MSILFLKIEVYLNVFFQKLLTKAKKIVIIFRQAKKRRSASMEKYSRGRRGAPAKGVGRVTGAKVQILSSPPTKRTPSRCPFLLVEDLNRAPRAQIMKRERVCARTSEPREIAPQALRLSAT